MEQLMNFKYDLQTNTSINNFYTMSTATNSFISSEIIPINTSSNHTSTEFENGKYSIITIANWFLLKGNMTHKKLQKLCYYAQAWCYALKDYRLINTDFQAWIHGPVSPALYDRFKCFGYDTIKIETNYTPKIEENDIALLEDIWDTYGDKSGNALEALTHRELPWIEARRGYEANERCTVVISPDVMRSFYKSIYSGTK